MRHNQRNGRPRYQDDEQINNEPFRMRIRKNRKKILLFLGVGLLLLVALVVGAIISLLTAVVPVGTQIASEAISSGEIGSVVSGVQSWVTQFTGDMNLNQWLGLFMQLN